MNHQNSRVGRVLVVMNTDLSDHETLLGSTLVRRAIDVAERFGSTLELFHVAHDPALDQGLFASDDSVRKARREETDRCATRLAELALRMKPDVGDVSIDVRWDQPRTEAILRKIADCEPDLVMKEAGEHSYVAGLVTHTDWDLARQSPAHVWFVKDGAADIDTIVTAIGTVSLDEDVISPADYDTYRLASDLAGGLAADVRPVHAYQVPPLNAMLNYAPELGAGPALQQQMHGETWREIARQHGRRIEEFARECDIAADDIEIVAGEPAKVIGERARELGAGLIVMGARNLTRWQRFTSAVTAEPVLAGAPCDVVVARDSDDLEESASAAKPIQGKPAFDLERAIIDPGSTFESPQQVVEARGLSAPLRKRILEAWASDIQSEMVEEDEGGPVRKTPADLLAAIHSATDELGREAGQTRH